MWVIGGAWKVYKTLKLLIGCLAVKLSIFVSKNNFHQIFADILRNCNENVKRILSSWLNPLKWVTNSTIVQHCFGKINCGVFMNFASILDKQVTWVWEVPWVNVYYYEVDRDQWTDNLKSNEKVCSISKRFLQISTLNQLESKWYINIMQM